MKKVFFIFFLLVFFIISLYGGIITLTYLNPLPKLDYTNYIEIYDNENKLVFNQIKGKETNYITYSNINNNILKCFINLEDKRFYNHNGFDYLRMIKAMYNNLVSGDLKGEGASSITQQTARTLFLDSNKSWKRKIKEAFYTIQLENSFSKEEIIEIYLNNIFFGGDLYGIESASLYYFDESSINLTLAQSAFLAGLVHSPNTYYYDELNDNALERKDIVLEVLYNNRTIDFDTYNKTKNEYLEIKRVKHNNISNLNYYRDSVILELKNLGYDVDKLLTQGIKVYTYLDNNIYQNINTIIEKYSGALENLELAIVIMKTDTPEIAAIFGGKDYLNSTYNRAINSKRQIGSTVKPLLYYLALLNDFTPLTKLMSERTVFHIKDYGDYAPINYGDIYPNRKITMLEAIATSDNIYAVKTMLYLGSKLLKNTLSLFAEEENSLPSLALGTTEMTLMELTNMYHTFASLGKKYHPSFIKKIETFSGKVLYSNSSSYTKMLSYDHLIVLASSLLAPYDKNAYKNIKPTMLNYQTDHPFATKTGSTKSDNYAIGYNPNYVIAVWTGNDEGEEIENSSISKLLFQNIANEISKELDEQWYKIGNSRVVEYCVDPIKGELSASGSNYYINIR